jgi:CBS domain-containing protein
MVNNKNIIMKVSDLMTKNIITTSPENNILDAIEKIVKNKVHSLPVVDDKNKLLGIITEMDFFIKKPNFYSLLSYTELINKGKEGGAIDKQNQKNLEEASKVKVKDVMTMKCVAVFKDMEIEELMETFSKTRFKTFPVIDKQSNLIGVVALVDVIKSLNR